MDGPGETHLSSIPSLFLSPYIKKNNHNSNINLVALYAPD